MSKSSRPNRMYLEVIVMFEPHRLQHDLLQTAYASLVPQSRRRLPRSQASSVAPPVPPRDLRARSACAMKEVQVALYARVSSEQQAEAKTIDSQLAEIRTRIMADGFELANALEFVDEGYSGSTLVRPALERLRDVAAAGGMDRLYVHCPDRFARHYASSGPLT